MADCPNCREPIATGLDHCTSCGEDASFCLYWRDGSTLVVRPGADLPPYCYKCGKPARAEPFSRTYYWHPSALYILVLFGLLIYVIAAAIVRKQIVLTLPICEEHFQSRRKLGWTSLALFVLAIVIPVLLIGLTSSSSLAGSFGCVVGFALGIASLVTYVKFDRTLRPECITDEDARLNGACPEFLDRVPSWGPGGA